MSTDASSSSDDEPASVIETPSPEKRRKLDKPKRFQCPADFVSFAHQPCTSTLIDNICDKNTEVWLIKAPNNFNPESFSNLKIPLSGLQTVKSQTPGARAQIYSVLGGSLGSAATDLRLLTSDQLDSGAVLCAPAFSGLLNVCESYGDCSTNLAPMAIPAALPPTIPPGLRQRFQPFGSKTPTLAAAQEDRPPSVSQPTPARIKKEVVTAVMEEERKKKKKKKKDKDKDKATDKLIKVEVLQVEEEQQEEVQEEQQQEEVQEEQQQEEVREGMVCVKEEGVTITVLAREAGPSEEKRKKKKKKKDKERDRGEVEDTVYPDVDVKEEVEVKVEPVDVSYGDLVDSGKKKKKKKIRHGDD